MPQPRLVAIVAMSSNRVIGRDGKLPWHLPADLKFFKRTTMGHPILMGRKTFESIGKPLPGRRNIILSRTMPPHEGIEVIRDITELAAPKNETVFLIGGAQLFDTLMPQCAGVYLTWIEKAYDGDTILAPFEHLFGEPKVIERGEGMEFRWLERRA